MGGFFASLLGGSALQTFVNAFAAPVVDIVKAYLDKTITEAQLAEKLKEAVLAAFAEVEKRHLDSITKTYTAFVQAMTTNPVITAGWKFVIYSQTLVLLWHQVGIPAFVMLVHWFFDPKFIYPSSGTTVEWAYALLTVGLGAPAIASRIGPAAGWAASFKGLIK